MDVFAEDAELVSLPLGDEGVEVSLLDLTGLVDTESTAARVLTPEERGEYARLAHPLRRREWLGARVCLKAMLLRRGCVSDPMQVAIMKDARGRPWLSFAPGLPGAIIHDCSLSHKGRFACAGASSSADTRIGVDVEKISPRLLRVAGAVVRERDTLIGSHSPEERLAMLWALKEACAKAAGGDIGVVLSDVFSRETAEGRHQVWTGDGREFRAWCVRRDEYVIALCLGTEPAGARGEG